MKFIHLSDLHLGKRVKEYSMLEDQRYILEQILSIIKEEEPDAILIAGDIYDKSVPSVEAVQLFDEFLVSLSEIGQQVFLISGNHDSPERLAFGGRLIDAAGIHIAPVYNGTVSSFSLEDSYGTVQIHLLPFVKPAHVRRFFPDESIESYTDALRVAVEHMQIDKSGRNVLVAHQFVTGASRSDSEESVGGLDNVDASVFEDFDYVALGHIHGPQSIGREGIRYCGTPLKYSFSEKHHHKSVTVAELGKKGELSVYTVALVPKTDLCEIRGTYGELVNKRFYDGKEFQNAYLHVVLTDEEDILDAVGRLHAIYPNLMSLEYDNIRTRSRQEITAAQQMEEKTPQTLFEELFELQNNQPMSEEQRQYLDEIVEKIWEEEI